MLTRKTTYGIRALVNIARAGERSLSVAEIAEREGIPQKFLAGILADLRQRGIVHGHRGPIGGYKLAVAPEELTIAAVVELLGGPLFPFVCLAREPHGERCRECPGAGNCPARQALSEACAAAYRVLGTLALSDIMQNPRLANEQLPAPLPEGDEADPELP
ncbi:MAG TPA: Rrf2 family transcriptional regulator [Polyangiaceae bacterium]|nr:Rrf2 family transcriptional regulator [Polyangiaceae bacterium]